VGEVSDIARAVSSPARLDARRRRQIAAAFAQGLNAVEVASAACLDG
jgi:hypothetical protein